MRLRNLNGELLDRALRLLETRLTEHCELVVCGGAALILAGMVPRTTGDVDIVALMRDSTLADPDPLPAPLRKAADEVSQLLSIDPAWLNNEPSRGDGGLFRMGLPEGFADRLHRQTYGPQLTVHFIHRIDQIHFKLYAAVDRGGYHVDDLRVLAPTDDELATAGRWCMTHDVSPGFRQVMREFLKEFGHEQAAQGL